MSGTNAVQCPACGGWVLDGSPSCDRCGQRVAGPGSPVTDPYSAGADQTLYAGAAPADPSRPSGAVVVGAQPTPTTPFAGLKVALLAVGALVLVAGALLVTVLVRGGSSTPPTTVVAAAPIAPTSETTAAPTTTSTTATTVITIAAASPPTADDNLLGNDLGTAHAREITAIDRFYRAIVASDWGYTGTHFINAESRGPNETSGWWESQYGTIDEYWLAPVRVTDGVVWMGLVTHETGGEGRYSYQFCIPFTVAANDFVRQTDQAVPRFTLKTTGEWIDPQPAAAALMSC